MAKPKHRVIVRARDARNGRFVKERELVRRPDTTIRDRMKVHPKKKGK